MGLPAEAGYGNTINLLCLCVCGGDAEWYRGENRGRHRHIRSIDKDRMNAAVSRPPRQPYGHMIVGKTDLHGPLPETLERAFRWSSAVLTQQEMTIGVRYTEKWPRDWGVTESFLIPTDRGVNRERTKRWSWLESVRRNENRAEVSAAPTEEELRECSTRWGVIYGVSDVPGIIQQSLLSVQLFRRLAANVSAILNCCCIIICKVTLPSVFCLHGLWLNSRKFI